MITTDLTRIFGLEHPIVLAPMAAIFWIFPGSASFWAIVAAVVFAWALKAAVFEPFAIACLMEVYFATIKDQVPDPEWDAKLADLSAKFRDLKDRALAHAHLA